MKSSKPKVNVAAGKQRQVALYAAGAAALIVYLIVYGPVMHTGFFFDDQRQVFALATDKASLLGWINTPVRPLLMATYWINYTLSGPGETYSYHVLNLLIHAATSLLVFAIVRRFAEWAAMEAGKREVLAAFAATLFLLHPAQTESVAYIAGRSESLSGMFACAAIAVFLYREGTAISWGRAAAVVLLALAAMLSKEQAVVLFGVLLLTDYWWNPGFSVKGIRANWRLYAPLLLGALGAVALFAKLILGIGTGGSAGFGMKEFTWYQYLFTQFRGIWVYIGHFLLPVNLNLDWDFPISRTLFDRGAIFGLIGLLGLAVAGWTMRHRFRLAAFGYLLFLLLLAPTSSIVPIKDPVADRRMYLPMIGLLLIAVDFASRWKLPRQALMAASALVVIVASAATYARAQVWSSAITLWQDTVAKSPNSLRAHFQLGFAYQEQGRNREAVAEFEKAESLHTPDYDLLLDLGLAYAETQDFEKSLATLHRAAALEQTAHVYTQIAKVQAQRGQLQPALEALDTAQKLDPNFIHIYVYRGLVHLSAHDPAGAIPQFQHALTLDPTFAPARDGLLQAQQMLRAPR